MLTRTIPSLTTIHLTTWLRENIPALKGKTALVTGASDGIGFWIASTLAQFGANVLLGCRSQKKGNRAVASIKQDHPHAQCSLLLLDLTDPASIHRASVELTHRLETLDILINNAGISADANAFTPEGIDLTFATNHLGTHVLTAKLLPILLATPAARIVTQSSLTHKLFFSPPDYTTFCNRYQSQRNSYAKSKLANLIFAHHLRHLLQSEGYTQHSLAAHPGLTFTNINRQAHTTTSYDFLSDLHDLAFNRMVLRTANKLQLCQPFQLAAALPCIYAAVCPNPTESFYFGPNGHLELSGLPQPSSPSPLVFDSSLATNLMQATEKITGIRLTC